MSLGAHLLKLLAACVAAFLVASLPLELVVPDAAAEDELLIRLLPDRSWELWHGPTRDSRERVAASTDPISPSDGDEAWESRAVLEREIDAFCERRGEAGQEDIRRVRIESAPGLSFRLVLEVASFASEHATEGLIASSRGREGGQRIRFGPAVVRRNAIVAGESFSEHELRLEFVLTEREVGLELTHTEVRFVDTGDPGWLSPQDHPASLGTWTFGRRSGASRLDALKSLSRAVGALRGTHGGEPRRLHVGLTRWDADLGCGTALAVFAGLHPELRILCDDVSFPDDWLDEISLGRR